MSRRTPVCASAVGPVRTSFVTGWSSGSMVTSWHTSVRRVAVRFLISLCLIDGKPPFAQERACLTEKKKPQAHLVGSLSGVQPYRNARASWKAPLCSAKPCSERGRTVSHVDEPFSLAKLTALCRLAGRSSVRSRTFSLCSRFWQGPSFNLYYSLIYLALVLQNDLVLEGAGYS